MTRLARALIDALVLTLFFGTLLFLATAGAASLWPNG